VVVALVGIGGVILGAVFGSIFRHWEWLRERRLTEYSDLLTAFRVAAAESSKATQGRLIYTTPADRDALHKLVAAAWDAGDRFMVAKDRVDLIGAPQARIAAADLAAHVLWLLKMKPLGDGDDAIDVQPNDFPTVSSKLHAAGERFKAAALSDVGNMSSWAWLRHRVGWRRGNAGEVEGSPPADPAGADARPAVPEGR